MAGGIQPVPMSRVELSTLLVEMAATVAEGDSFGGSIEYDALEAPEGVDYLVHGVYRIGNSQGQGGMRVIGTFPE